MREIKFRVFSKIQNKMIYPNHRPHSISKLEINYSGAYPYAYVLFERTYEKLITSDGYKGENPTLNGVWKENKFYDKIDGEIFHNPEMINVMQFTGLKDKNEKEIYEGDICHMNENDTKDKSFDMMGMCGEFGVVVFRGAGYDMELQDTKRFMSIQESDIEIIGNIYESPELLKGEKE